MTMQDIVDAYGERIQLTKYQKRNGIMRGVPSRYPSDYLKVPKRGVTFAFNDLNPTISKPNTDPWE